MTTPDHSGEAITILKVDAHRETALAPLSPAQRPDGRIEDRYTAYFENISPPLSWQAVPGAAAYALVVEDPDAPREQPFIHWMIWNIPGELSALPEGIANEARPTTPQDAVQGRNDMGGYGWFGPRPPAGHGLHRYYFQLFALDAPLDMGPDTPLAELLNALKGQTLAKGELVMTYEAPASQ